MARLLKDQEKVAGNAERRHNSKTSPSKSQSEETEDDGKQFVQEDYENTMTYLEDSKNYTSLFGNGSNTTICENLKRIGVLWELNPHLLCSCLVYQPLY